MSEERLRTFQEFKDYFNNLSFTKAYQPLIIQSLAESYPQSVSKGRIAEKIRGYYHNNESYAQYNIWNTLSDYHKLTRELNGGFYALNVEKISPEQTREIIELCREKIKKLGKTMELESPQINTIQNVTQYPTYTINNEQVQNNESTDETIVVDDEDTDEFESDNTTNATNDYFLIQIDINFKKEVNIDRLRNYGVNLTRKEKRILNVDVNKTHNAILYDTLANYMRIWGKTNLKLGEPMDKNDQYVKIINFQPVSEVVNGSVTPMWVPPELAKEAMFTNRKITKIQKEHYEKILQTCVKSNELFTKESEKNIPKEPESVQYLDDQPLEIPSKNTLEKGIKEIEEILLIDKKTIEEIVINLASGRHILLAGPIGTGKTRLSTLIPQLFWSSSDTDHGYNAKVYTASYEWDVTDVIGGIVPRMSDNDEPTYKMQYGCVVETVKESWECKKHNNNSKIKHRGTWLVIDEFNRAEIDKAFGQLFTSLESPRILHVPHEQIPTLTEIKIPWDYRIIGTLNTSDKHYLFKLSDALKRRFAYIEVKSPPKSESEKEIFYAVNNAMEELSSERVSSMVNLNKLEKKLSDTQINTELVSAIRSAYEILSFVRMTEDMGTAILKSIYQTILVGTQIDGYNDSILDIALNGNLIPQLERVHATNIEVISKFCLGDVHSFFMQMYNTPDDDTRQKYADDFENYVKFLGIPDTEKLKEKYWRKIIEPDTWGTVLQKWNERKIGSNLPRNLTLFKSSLDDLKKTFEFL